MACASPRVQRGAQILSHVGLWRESTLYRASLAEALNGPSIALRIAKSSLLGCQSGCFAPSRHMNSWSAAILRLLPQPLGFAQALAREGTMGVRPCFPTIRHKRAPFCRVRVVDDCAYAPRTCKATSAGAQLR